LEISECSFLSFTSSDKRLTGFVKLPCILNAFVVAEDGRHDFKGGMVVDFPFDVYFEGISRLRTEIAQKLIKEKDWFIIG